MAPEYTTLTFRVTDEELAEIDEAMRMLGIGVGMSRATRSDFIRAALHTFSQQVKEEGYIDE